MIDLEKTLEFFSSSNILGMLDRRGRKRVVQCADKITFADKSVVVREGDIGNAFYIIMKGKALISVDDMGTQKAVAELAEGSFFGEMAVLDNKPRSACATAVKDTRAYFIPRAPMLKLVEHSPALSLVLLREISQRLREFDRQYIRELLRAERLAVLGRFARSIVHDLKGPLNIIGITAELAGVEGTPAEFRQTAMTRIRKQVERITDLINDILEFTQGPVATAGLAPVDYSVFVQQVAEEIRPDVEMKAVQIELENPPPPVHLRLNPKRLRRVFYNLIHNATDAMPKGGKVILRFHADKSELVTEVEDTGPGIAPEIADRLFEPFATHGKIHGTGLGLSICKRIIEDHRGRIWARTESGRGAVFAFALPLA